MRSDSRSSNIAGWSTPRFSSAGTWTVSSVTLIDDVGKCTRVVAIRDAKVVGIDTAASASNGSGGGNGYKVTSGQGYAIPINHALAVPSSSRPVARAPTAPRPAGHW